MKKLFFVRRGAVALKLQAAAAQPFMLLTRLTSGLQARAQHNDYSTANGAYLELAVAGEPTICARGATTGRPISRSKEFDRARRVGE